VPAPEPILRPTTPRVHSSLTGPIVGAVITMFVFVGLFAGWLVVIGPRIPPRMKKMSGTLLAREDSTTPSRSEDEATITKSKDRPRAEEKKPADEPTEPAPPKEDPTAAGLTFEKDVLPIFKNKCVGCHGVAKKKGGVDLRTVTALLKGGENGPSIVPGSSAKSLLWEQLQTNRMPPGKTKLTPAEKDTIKKWINARAKDEAAASR
jgi:hypothetical protein